MEDGERSVKKQEYSSEEPMSLSDLHESLLHQILARLDVYNLPACAQVCKKWHLIISTSPSFARLHALLHREHTWFTLFTAPSRNFMAVYDIATGMSMSMGCLESADDTPDSSNSENDEPLANNEPLATAEGLVLSRSKHGNFTITNIVTRKKRPLLSPDPPIHHLAFVGMAYSWPSMSYQILLCGLEKKRATRLITSVYNSLTRGWTNASSSLSAMFFVPETFANPRNCVWFDGRFYCSMGRALHFFDLASMEWGDLFSPRLHESLDHPFDRMQVWLPKELTHFFFLWEHEGELLLAGSADKKESKIVTEIWRLVPPPFEKAAAIAGSNDSITFQWKHIASIPVVDLEAGVGTCILPGCQGKQPYAQGGTVCLSITHKDLYSLGVLSVDVFMNAQVQFYVYDLVKERFKSVKSIWAMDVVGGFCRLANLAIHPCPFTSP